MPRGRHIAAELRDECLNQEIFFSLKEAQIVIEQWRNQYNTIRPHSSIGYRPPAPQTSTGKQPNLDQHAPIQWSLSDWPKISVRPVPTSCYPRLRKDELRKDDLKL